MKKILFVCSGNTCRSVMAETIFNKLAKKKKLKYVASSAGVYANAGDNATQNTIYALKNLKITLKKHSATQFSLDDMLNYDFVIAVTREIKNYIGKFDNVFCFQDLISTATDIVDPYNQSEEVYLKTAMQTKEYIEKLIKILGDSK